VTGQSHDLGTGHSYRFVVGDTHSWPDTYGMITNHDDGTQTTVTGIIETHPRTDNGQPCEGLVSFVRPLRPSEHEAARPVWIVNSLDPLDLDPSILCTVCGAHGYIRRGVWVNA
jgi:hypothetical protein